MNIYWNQKDIPALKGLSRKERELAKRTVIHQVWKHWQVWLPFAVQFTAFTAFIFLTPQFPYRLAIIIVAAVTTSKVASLPFHHYIDFYLKNQPPRS